MTSTGFARRLSKRMKHLAVPEEPTPEPEKSTPPPDSAYSSGSDHKLSKGTKVRPESILAPLPPKFEQPTYSSRVSGERSRNQAYLKNDGGMSVMSMASTSKSRSMGKSFKNVFQRTWRRGRMLAA
jgi:hypothetical protein